jgi:serine O-acetyltransferase
MTRHTASLHAAETIDLVWSRIKTEAEEIVRNDPALGGFIYGAVLNHDSFEEALVHRLAQRLGTADISADQVIKAFEDALKAEPEIAQAARADILATYDRDPACTRYVEPLLYFKGYQSLQTYRMAHRLYLTGRKDFALYLQSRVSVVASVDIHPAAKIGRGIMIDHGHDIVIGETAVVEDNVSMLHGVTLGGTGKEEGDRHPKVRKGVLIGAGAKILGNIEIGPCSRVAAGSVVLHSVPPKSTVAGVPARLVGNAGCEEPARRMDHSIEDVAGLQD